VTQIAWHDLARVTFVHLSHLEFLL
jgi:hypothetical protein